VAVVANEIERGNAVIIPGDSFAVDDAGARAQAGQRLDDQGEATGGIVARTAIEPHPPEGSLSVFVGRHGATNPAGKARCNMRKQIELGRRDCNFTIKSAHFFA
jgi:hypothetical protein